MLALVRIALSRPYTFIVLALLILIIGTLSITRTPKDIFPSIDIPIISVAWQYTGLPPDEMAGRIISQFERSLTTTVNNIEHIESTSYTDFGIVKIFFHPNVDINMANAQVTAISQTLVRRMPDGTQPPLILNYSASTVPVMQLALSGKGLTEQQLADLAMNQLRAQLVMVEGAAIPWPFGGKSRQLQLDVDPAALKARGLTAQDVAIALAEQNVVIPAGNQKIDEIQYAVKMNNAPDTPEAIGDIPVKQVDGTVVYVRDVANVYDGSAVQTNIVHVDGGRSVLMSVFKNGDVSTLDLIKGIKDKLEEVKPQLPEELEVKIIGDQSLFVTAAIHGVVVEGIIAALLTSLMILLFLGSWRSTLIVTTSIPLSILGAIICMYAMGDTLNIMTLGGLALAVGILVDEATVTIESINTYLEKGEEVPDAIINGSSQVAVPAFVSLLCICIVFVPMYFLQGIPYYLFVPLAQSVMLSMVFSFLLSRTLVPTLAKYLLKPHEEEEHGKKSRNPLVRFQKGFESGFGKMQQSYRRTLDGTIEHRKLFIGGFLLFVTLSFGLLPFVGQNFFPRVDSGQILLHARAPIGTRVEETAAKFAEVEKVIRQVIPTNEIKTLADNVGTYMSSINTTYNNTGMIGSQDGDITVSLTEGHAPTDDYIRKLREVLPEKFPGMSFAFLPADIVSQTLNFGAPSPIDVQIRGKKIAENYSLALKMLEDIRRIPGVVDARVHQSRSAPILNVEVDRTQAAYAGVTQSDITNSVVVNLAGSSQVAPTYWLNPENGVSYPIVMQTPQYRVDTLDDLKSLPINAEGADETMILGNVAEVSRGKSDAVVTHYNIQPLIQIYATTQDRDLGGVSTEIQKVIDKYQDDVPRGSSVKLAGQVSTMNTAFNGLLYGLLGAIALVYFLIVINFQSWSDPFVIITALPAALAGIVWMLFITETPFSVPALTGSIMCMGVATANSVLVISFARQQLDKLGNARDAAIEAGFARLRPVMMTALAMIIGMLPMSLGLGEGGEQNAPLGRAVIGGLLFATVATLFFVPVIFSMIHGRKQARSKQEENQQGVTQHVTA